jgi:TrmH family RNA methyltransferase
MAVLDQFVKRKTQMPGINSPQVKEARDLLLAKFNSANSSLFICEGMWAADKLIAKGIEIETVFYDSDHFADDGRASQEEADTLCRVCRSAKNVYAISPKACSKISDRDGADVCFIIARMPSVRPEDIELSDDMLAMILDGQEQPGNIGAILRSLDAAGGDFAVLTNRRVRLNHPRLIRSSLGSAFMMPVLDMPMEELIKWLEDNHFRIVLTDLSATQNFCDIPAKGRVAVVAGNEHTGISPVWRTLKGAEPVIIPMLGSVESLNVGFASTLVAYNLGLRKKGLMGHSQ